MVAVLSVLVVIALSILLTRIATIALTLTGMSREAARFQARSALTGTGFATRESEAVVNHPVRRQVIMTLMLVGSAGIVTVITTLILSFVGTASVRDATTRLAALLAGLVGLFVLATNRRVNPCVAGPDPCGPAPLHGPGRPRLRGSSACAWGVRHLGTACLGRQLARGAQPA